MGRRKIKMEVVQDMNTRQVTFSKRRTGLFKKASELATLCNAELGILVFSPGGKPFSYGKPSLDFNQEIDSERKRSDMLQEQLESAGDEKFLKPIEEFSLKELKEYRVKLQKRQSKIQGQASEMQASATLMLISNFKAPENEDLDA